MPPITWKTVNPPSNAAGLAGLSQAAKDVGDGFRGVGKAFTDYSDGREEADTDALLAQIAGAPDDAARADIISQAKSGFLDMSKVADARTTAQNQDFRVDANERAIGANDRAQNVFEYDESQRPAKEARLKASDLALKQDQNMQIEKFITDAQADATEKNAFNKAQKIAAVPIPTREEILASLGGNPSVAATPPITSTAATSPIDVAVQRIAPVAAQTAPATFERAIPGLLQREGGYVNNPADEGGETNFGISSKWNPGVDVKNLTPEKASAIHRKTWDNMNIDQLPDQLKDSAFDAATNQGPTWTRKALAKANGNLAKFQQLRRDRYAELSKRKDQAQFANGWENRVAEFDTAQSVAATTPKQQPITSSAIIKAMSKVPGQQANAAAIRREDINKSSGIALSLVDTKGDLDNPIELNRVYKAMLKKYEGTGLTSDEKKAAAVDHLSVQLGKDVKALGSDRLSLAAARIKVEQDLGKLTPQELLTMDTFKKGASSGVGQPFVAKLQGQVVVPHVRAEIVDRVKAKDAELKQRNFEVTQGLADDINNMIQFGAPPADIAAARAAFDDSKNAYSLIEKSTSGKDQYTEAGIAEFDRERLAAEERYTGVLPASWTKINKEIDDLYNISPNRALNKAAVKDVNLVNKKVSDYNNKKGDTLLANQAKFTDNYVQDLVGEGIRAEDINIFKKKIMNKLPGFSAAKADWIVFEAMGAVLAANPETLRDTKLQTKDNVNSFTPERGSTIQLAVIKKAQELAQRYSNPTKSYEVKEGTARKLVSRAIIAFPEDKMTKLNKAVAKIENDHDKETRYSTNSPAALFGIPGLVRNN